MFEPPSKPTWWLPTMGFFLFLAIALCFFAAPGRIFEDPGVGRHLRTAEFILETGQVPRADPLSWTKAGQPWTDFEWAFETTLGELYRAGGLPLIAAFCYTLFATTVLVIYRTLLRCGVSLVPLMVVTFLVGGTLVIHFSARPVLFTYLFFALVVEVWNRQAAPRLIDWICLPVVFVAWANLHAGWLGALAFLGLALAGRMTDRMLGRSDGNEAPLIPWLGLTALCALATWFNPWGWGLWRAVLHLATGLKSASLWIEYLPPNFGTPSLVDIRMAAIAVLFLLVVVIMARAGTRAPRWSWSVVLPVLFFLWEGLKMQRHVLLLMEIAAVPLARDLQALLPRAPQLLEEILARFQAQQREAGGDAWLAMVAAVLIAVFFAHTPLAKPIQAGQVATPEVVAFLRDHPDRFQRPFTTTAEAGPLLWALRPDFRVSIDDRGDFYGDDYVYKFVDTLNANEGWEKTLNTGRFDSLLLEPNWPLNRWLMLSPDWKEAWRNKDVIIYWRDNSQSENIKP